MTPDELNGALRILHGAYGGEWTDERNGLWAEALQRYSLAVTVAALRQMIDTERWPVLAVFHEIAKAHEGGPYCAPGSGALPEYHPNPEPITPPPPGLMERMRDTIKGKPDA